MKRILLLIAAMLCLAVPVLAEEADASPTPTHTIIFDPCNGEEPWVYETDHNGWLKDWHAAPEREGYTFSYWDDGRGHHLTANQPWYSSYDRDTTFTAVYTANDSNPPVTAYLGLIVGFVILIILLSFVFII